MYYVYIIKSKEGRFYTGSTQDIQKRLLQHNQKTFKCWTNRFNDWKLVYSEAFQTRTEALIREKQIKKMKGGREFKKLVGS